MNKDVKNLKVLDFEDFKNINTESVEVLSDTLYTLALDSILCSRPEALEKDLKSMLKSFEKISNYLELEDPNNLLCYNFGKISTITYLILNIPLPKNT